MVQPQIFEGTAEEIADKLRGSNLAGALTAIITPKELPAQNGNTTTPSLADTLTDFLAEVDQIEYTPGKPSGTPEEQEVSRLIAQKFVEQGHTR
jgi:hypothetical protein